MIHSIVEYINAIIKPFGYVDTYNGVAVLYQVDDAGTAKKSPHIYDTSGNYKPVDKSLAPYLYHRQLSGATEEELDDSFIACEIRKTVTYPMRMVVYFDKAVLKTDNANIEARILSNLSNAMSADNLKNLALALGAELIQVQIKTTSVDSYNLWTDEHAGIDYRVDSKNGYIAIDYDAIITGNASCFLAYGCNDATIDIAGLVGVRIYDNNEELVTVIPPGGCFIMPPIISSGSVQFINYRVPNTPDTTYISKKKVKFTALAGIPLTDLMVFYDGAPQKYNDSTTVLNEIKDILPDGTIEWNQNVVMPGRELRVIYKGA